MEELVEIITIIASLKALKNIFIAAINLAIGAAIFVAMANYLAKRIAKEVVEALDGRSEEVLSLEYEE